MKWLILCGNKKNSNTKKIQKYFTESKIDFVMYHFSKELSAYVGDEYFYKMGELCERLQGVSHVLCINIDEIPLKGVFLFSLGILSYSKFSLYHLGDEPLISKQIEKLHISESISIDSLVKKLSIDFDSFIKNEKRKQAVYHLEKANISLSSENFSQYIREENIDMCNLFVDAGFDINSLDNEGIAMISIAVRCNSFVMVEWLIQKNVIINVISQDRGYTPLMDAVWKNNVDIVDLLIQNGADVHTVSKDGQPLTVLAAGVANFDICSLLFKSGANIYEKDHMGMSAYDYAKLFHHEEILKAYEAVEK